METNGIKTVLWDADVIVYRVGFASKEPEPLSYTLQSVKTVLENVNVNFPNADEIKLYLTGGGNYRDKVSTTKIYKGNRDPTHKPEYYDEIREYLITYHGAQVVDGREADDQLGIEQWKTKDKSSCIVTIDKDLDCIPGWHYNWVRKEMYYQTLADANRTFWTQVLTGDSTDNIQGLPKVGPKKAEKLLASSDGTWADLYQRVRDAYESYYKEDADAILHEMATLTWIQREEGINYDGRPILQEVDGGEESTEESS